jgi:hypothetical protein
VVWVMVSWSKFVGLRHGVTVMMFSEDRVTGHCDYLHNCVGGSAKTDS